MNVVHWLVLLSAIISIAGASFYIRDTLKGKSKPNRVTWSMWALSPLIGAGAALSANADVWATIRIFTGGFFPLLVIPSIPVWNIQNSAFQIYLLIANTLLLFVVYRKRLHLLKV